MSSAHLGLSNLRTHILVLDECKTHNFSAHNSLLICGILVVAIKNPTHLELKSHVPNVPLPVLYFGVAQVEMPRTGRLNHPIYPRNEKKIR